MLDFAIIGAAKSGTSTLRAALDAHPELSCARETHFFCERFDRGTAWYEAQLAPGQGVRAGEKCPDYLPNPVAIGRLADYAPDARLLVVLRDPVARAYSHYWHDLRGVPAKATFEEAVERDDSVYRRWGEYVTQLEGVRTHFPAANLFVTLFEDLRESPEETYARACRFLGVDDSWSPPEARGRANSHQRLRHPRLWGPMFQFHLWDRLPVAVTRPLWNRMTRDVVDRYPPMAEATRRRLDEHYAGWNQRLASWLVRELAPDSRPADLGAWRHGGAATDSAAGRTV